TRILDVDHGVHVVASGNARLEPDFKGVVAPNLHRSGDVGGLAIELGAKTHEHGAWAAYVEEGATRLAHRARPVFGQVEFAGHGGDIVDLGGLGAPFHVIPLDGAHAQERFLRALSMRRSRLDVKRQGQPQGGNTAKPGNALLEKILCVHYLIPSAKPSSPNAVTSFC